MKLEQMRKGWAVALARLVKCWRKCKAKVMGVYPCTYETKHGHDFEVLEVKRYSGIPVVHYKCKCCGLLASYDPYTGLCT